MPYGVATPTIAVSPVPFSYIGTGATLALGIGFIPTSVRFVALTNSWEWTRGMPFGDAMMATTTIGLTSPNTGGVLDVLDGSGIASANTATTSQVCGLLIGTSTIVNNGAALMYRGLCYR